MSAETTRAALEAIHAAFGSGDSDRLAALYHDDIDWIFHAPLSVFPFAGARRGKAEVFKGFELLYRDYRLTGFDILFTIADEHRAAALTETHMVQRATGRTLTSRVAGFHHFRDGRLIEYRGFTDSFDAVEQALGHELPI